MKKPTSYQCFWISLLTFLVACSKQTVTLPAVIPTLANVLPTANPTATFLPINPSPLPTAPTIPIITPDPVQVESWKEYQSELAKLVLSEAGDPFADYASAICEWDILGYSDQEVYVWAKCLALHAGDTKPAVIHLATDGSVQKVEIPIYGTGGNSTIQSLFPIDIQEKINSYFSSASSYSGRAEELRTHLIYRRTHPEVPPIIILSAILTATSTP